MDWSFRYERTLSFCSTSISVVAFSHDFTKLISANGSGDIKVWDTAQWSELATLQPSNGDERNSAPRSVSVSPGGALACCHPHVVYVYSSKYELVLSLKPSQDLGYATWRCLCFSPTRVMDERTGETGEDNLLVAWTETSLCVYPVDSESTQPRLTRSVLHASGPPRVCGFTRCGTHVVCGHDDGQIYVWNVSSFTLQRTLVGHLGAVTSLDFSVPSEEHSSMLVTCSLDKSLRIWEANEKGWQLAYFISVSLVHDHQAVRSCQFSRDGTFFVTTCGLELVVWKWFANRQRKRCGATPLVPHQKLKGCMNGMRLQVVAAGLGQIVVGSIEGVLGVWAMGQEAPPVQEQLVKYRERIEQKPMLASVGERTAMGMSSPKSPKKLEIISPKNTRTDPRCYPARRGARESAERSRAPRPRFPGLATTLFGIRDRADLCCLRTGALIASRSEGSSGCLCIK
eukprot:GEMP01011439.1.p1 GENE.GEMP01011439.1~~GEMP01011439.1.p1  ORF type:complete len:456 (+),score=61.55 GEMP01011439.1:83-1450(+)